MTRFASVACVLTIAAAWSISPAAGQGAATAPLTYSQPLAPGATEMVQEKLASRGAYHGTANGVWGPDSASALISFQQTHGLQPTGEMNQSTAVVLGLDPATLLGAAGAAALAPPVASTTLSIAAVRALQSRLRQLGYYDGALDGEWGPEAEGALTRFQQASGIPPSGRINPRTVTAMGLDPSDLTASATQ